MKTPEGYEKDDICKFLDSIGAWYFRPFMAGYGKSGVPDIVACIDGQFWGIEVKRPGKQPTKRQHDIMNRIGASGGCTAAGTADDVIRQIKNLSAYEKAAYDA